MDPARPLDPKSKLGLDAAVRLIRCIFCCIGRPCKFRPFAALSSRVECPSVFFGDGRFVRDFTIAGNEWIGAIGTRGAHQTVLAVARLAGLPETAPEEATTEAGERKGRCAVDEEVRGGSACLRAGGIIGKVRRVSVVVGVGTCRRG